MQAIFIFIVFILFSTFPLFAQEPSFTKYPSKAETIKAREVNLKSHPTARKFRTNLRESFKEGVNFGGRFIISTWGCGTGCAQSAIIDTRSGRVFFPGPLQGTAHMFGELEDKDKLEYSSDSRLLIVNGQISTGYDRVSERYGVYYYLWTGTNLKLLRFVKKSQTGPIPAEQDESVEN